MMSFGGDKSFKKVWQLSVQWRSHFGTADMHFIVVLIQWPSVSKLSLAWHYHSFLSHYDSVTRNRGLYETAISLCPISRTPPPSVQSIADLLRPVMPAQGGEGTNLERPQCRSRRRFTVPSLSYKRPFNGHQWKLVKWTKLNHSMIQFQSTACSDQILSFSFTVSCVTK